MKKIMVVAGGTWQVPLIKKIKEMNYQVVNSNLYEDSIGFKYADETFVADVKNIKANIECANKFQVDAVVTDQTDIAVPTVAAVAEAIGSRTIGVDKAQLFTNKFKMREYCQESGFNAIQYRLCEEVEDALEFYETLGKTIIIKPLDAQSSRGVYVIHSKEELVEKFEQSKMFSSDGKYVIAERYIQGTEFTIDGVMVGGKHYTTAISEKAHYDYNPTIAKSLLFTYDNDRFDYQQLRKQHDELIDSTGLSFGLTHAEYKFENGEFYLIEMAARGGGTKISSDISPYVSGVDSYEILINDVLENKVEEVNYEKIAQNKEKCAILEFLDIESNGKAITSIMGQEEIRNIPEVIEFQLEFKAGDIIQKAEDDRSRVGFYIICAESRDRLEEVRVAIKETLQIKFD